MKLNTKNSEHHTAKKNCDSHDVSCEKKSTFREESFNVLRIRKISRNLIGNDSRSIRKSDLDMIFSALIKQSLLSSTRTPTRYDHIWRRDVGGHRNQVTRGQRHWCGSIGEVSRRRQNKRRRQRDRNSSMSAVLRRSALLVAYWRTGNSYLAMPTGLDHGIHRSRERQPESARGGQQGLPAERRVVPELGQHLLEQLQPVRAEQHGLHHREESELFAVVRNAGGVRAAKCKLCPGYISHRDRKSALMPIII